MTEEEKCCCGGSCGCNDEMECCDCEGEVEEFEFELSGSEIDEWINELSRLKEEKDSIYLEIDEETVLKINYSDEEIVEESEEMAEDE